MGKYCPNWKIVTIAKKCNGSKAHVQKNAHEVNKRPTSAKCAQVHLIVKKQCAFNARCNLKQHIIKKVLNGWASCCKKCNCWYRCLIKKKTEMYFLLTEDSSITEFYAGI